jgi:hypothetical protein
MPSDHQIVTLDPLYRGHAAVCICGWTSPECRTAGEATIAGWQHIHTSPAEITTEAKA